ncbi:MAG: phosphate transporter periplasmic phosphate-binding protein [Ilumatobacteraceae bacterium]|nr:phosphate transporter periplasmic phosphate-binding protein [Ilumatobacteraceae bacterium]
MNNSRKRMLAISGIVTLSLLAGACSSDSKTTTTTAAPATTAAAATTAASTVDTGAATTVAGSADTTATTAGSATSTVDTTATTTGDSTATTTGDSVVAPTIDYKSLSGTLAGSGSTFQKAFLDEAIADLAEKAPNLSIQYGGGGSGKGRTDLQTKLVDYAGTDGTVKDADVPLYTGGAFIYIPTVIAPITMSYNLSGVDKLQLSPKTIADIFELKITKWNDPEIAADNAGVTLPDTDIVTVHRSDASGTTQNFTNFLEQSEGKAASGEWTLGAFQDPTVWPAGGQAGDGNGGVAQIIGSTDGAIGYVDLSDAKSAGLAFASVENKAGKFVEPTLEATSAAAENVTVKDDLTFSLAWADGATSYPIAAQTWILVYTKQPDAEHATNLKAFLDYLLTDGQTLAPTIDYAPLPTSLVTKALANVEKITS